jgi:hypothetical protein
VEETTMTAAHAARRGQRTASDSGLDVVLDQLGPRKITAPNYPPRVEVAAAAHRLGVARAAVLADQAVRQHGVTVLPAQVRATWPAR